MKRLFLFRHARAIPAEPGVQDSARPLLPSGAQDAGAVALYIRRQGYAPDLILSSNAARATQTAEIVLKQIRAPVKYHEVLYLATAAKLLATVQAAPAAASGLMLVGHNPGLQELLTLLARTPPRRKRRGREMADEPFPTAALAILDFDAGRWRDVAPRGGEPVDFVRPKDL
jgi:phosphohistidine phosphatase